MFNILGAVTWVAGTYWLAIGLVLFLILPGAFGAGFMTGLIVLAVTVAAWWLASVLVIDYVRVHAIENTVKRIRQ